MSPIISWCSLIVPVLLLSLVSAEDGGSFLRPTAQNNVTVDSGRRLEDQGINAGSIVSGSDYPFFALLFGASGFDDAFFCGGVLIRREWVLTAASCFDNRNRMSFVRLGGDDILDGEQVDVDEILIHPRYRKLDSGILEYDFALLKLKSRAAARPARININTQFPSLSGVPLETIGYGADTSGFPSFFLEQVNLESVSFGSCQETFLAGISDNLHECALAVDNPFAGPCGGDAGGPLLFDGDAVIGITSFGKPCGSQGVDVFSKVSSNFYWIATQAGIPIPTPRPTMHPTPAPTHPRPTHPSHPSPSSDSSDSHPSSDYDDPSWCDPALQAISGFGNRMFGWTSTFFGGSENPDSD